MKKTDPKNRFWNKVDKTPGHGPQGTCWLWTGAKSDKGYGRIKERRKYLKAHRVSYEIANGSIPEGEGYHGTCVCHSCDTPACVNPEHLFLGPARLNRQDCVEKNRHWRGERMSAQIRGEGHPRHRLKESDILAIRKDRRIARLIADDYGVSIGHIYNIKDKRCWSHL